MSRYARKPSDIHQIIIHCSATPNGRPHTAADIDFWHGQDRINRELTPFKRDPDLINGYAPTLKHIGYHYVITTDGTLCCGRHYREEGAHAAGHNAHSIGICMMGMDKFSPAQWSTLRILVLGLQARFPLAHSVIGHRVVAPYKTCPGFDVTAWLQSGMQAPTDHVLEKTDGNKP